ncbi:MAG: class I SAM-dependent methyltransferase [Bryobacteraceae bacterium]|nr:class I SAM-dependent methyltransferase [Bryobacteraceae bacterium]
MRSLCWLVLWLSAAGDYEQFCRWRKSPGNAHLAWEKAIERYAAQLRASGLSQRQVEKSIHVISAHDEATLYDPIYAQMPKFETRPNRLLLEAVKGRRPGRALDVGMGQGRNSIALARLGWQVTGFDVSDVGLRQARRQAAQSGLRIEAVLAADEEFDFGTAQWDLIAILYPLEKRSIYRVRQALKPGGIVVVECGHKNAGSAPFEYDTRELLQILDGFRILKYEDGLSWHEWAQKELRMVKLIAQKP